MSAQQAPSPAPPANVLQLSNDLLVKLTDLINTEMQEGRANHEVAYNALNNALAHLAIRVGATEGYAKNNLGRAYRNINNVLRSKGPTR